MVVKSFASKVNKSCPVNPEASKPVVLPFDTTVYAAFRDSIVVSISACHADDPGSIPGRGAPFVFYFSNRQGKNTANDGDRTRDLLLTKQTLYH